ncbi:MAG: hypothetical protein PVH30_08410 [Desulfobacterales bacterium]|jgi:hypothetical protein
MSKQNMLQLMREHKTLFVVIGVCLLLLELEIFALAAMKSGRKATIQVVNDDGAIVYETDGANLSQFDKYYFEQNFGPLDRYDLRFITREEPFPFRAWFVAAFGIPVGGMLLFAFLVRAYLAVFYGETKPGGDPHDQTAESMGHSPAERLLLRLSRFNIFTIGFLILLGVVAYWVVPNLIAYLSRVGIETLTRYRWVFLGIGAIVIGLVTWIVYLRFLLAKKSLETQAELERYRLELEYQSGSNDRKRLPDAGSVDPMVTWQPTVETTSEKAVQEDPRR